MAPHKGGPVTFSTAITTLRVIICLVQKVFLYSNSAWYSNSWSYRTRLFPTVNCIRKKREEVGGKAFTEEIIAILGSPATRSSKKKFEPQGPPSPRSAFSQVNGKRATERKGAQDMRFVYLKCKKSSCGLDRLFLAGVFGTSWCSADSLCWGQTFSSLKSSEQRHRKK